MSGDRPPAGTPEWRVWDVRRRLLGLKERLGEVPDTAEVFERGDPVEIACLIDSGWSHAHAAAEEIRSGIETLDRTELDPATADAPRTGPQTMEMERRRWLPPDVAADFAIPRLTRAGELLALSLLEREAFTKRVRSEEASRRTRDKPRPADVIHGATRRWRSPAPSAKAIRRSPPKEWIRRRCTGCRAKVPSTRTASRSARFRRWGRSRPGCARTRSGKIVRRSCLTSVEVENPGLVLGNTAWRID